MAERFFAKITNDVLEATEQVANRMEEGLNLLLNGAAANTKEPAQEHSANYIPYDEDDQAHIEEALRNNPLQGIADSVVGGIMSGQVGLCMTVGSSRSAPRSALHLCGFA